MTAHPGSASRRSAAVRWVAMLTVDALAALCFVVIKTGPAYADPLAFAGLRTLLAGATLLGLATLTTQSAAHTARSEQRSHTRGG